MADQISPEEISIGAALAREAARQPDALAVFCEGESRSWVQLHRNSNRIARALEKIGVKQGDFLTIALPNGVEFVEASYAAWKLGAVPQPVSWRLPHAELKAIVELAETPVVIGAPAESVGVPALSVAQLLAEEHDDS